MRPWPVCSLLFIPTALQGSGQLIKCVSLVPLGSQQRCFLGPPLMWAYTHPVKAQAAHTGAAPCAKGLSWGQKAGEGPVVKPH